MNLSVNYGKSFFFQCMTIGNTRKASFMTEVIYQHLRSYRKWIQSIYWLTKTIAHYNIFDWKWNQNADTPKTLQLEKKDDPRCKYVRCRKKHSFFFGKGVRVSQNWTCICFAILVQIVSYGQQIDQSQGENRLIYMINLSLSWSFNRKSVYFLCTTM